MKKNIQLFGKFLWSRKSFYIAYLCLCFIFIVTFHLYSLNLSAFIDGVLFSLTILLCLSALDFLFFLRQHLLLEKIQHQSEYYFDQLNHLPRVIEPLTNDYQQLFLQAVAEKEKIAARKQQDMQELMDYYAMWSHQIKTPLAAVSLLSQTEQINQNKLKNEIFKIESYLDMMLHYLKMQELENDLVFESVELSKLIKAVVRKFATFFIDKDLSVEIADFEKEIVTDEKWLNFILEQLIFNSIKYTHSGGIKIYWKDEQLIIEDSGIGILSQDLPRIFDRGYTGFNGREDKKATGLGLHMSGLIAEKLGIQLTLKSEVKEGTKAHLFFNQETYEME